MADFDDDDDSYLPDHVRDMKDEPTPYVADIPVDRRTPREILPTVPRGQSYRSLSLLPIAYPAGAPHAVLKDFDEQSIHVWCDRNIEEGDRHGWRYTATALVYWVRTYLDYGTQAFNDVRDIILAYVGDPSQD